MPGKHKRQPISLRLPEDDENWLRARAAATGRAVNAIVADAVSRLRSQLSPDPRDPKEGDS